MYLVNGPHMDERLVGDGADDGTARHHTETVWRTTASFVRDKCGARVQVPCTSVP